MQRKKKDKKVVVSIDNSEVKHLITRLKKEKKMSYTKIAATIGVSSRTLRNWIQNITSPTRKKRTQLLLLAEEAVLPRAIVNQLSSNGRLEIVVDLLEREKALERINYSLRLLRALRSLILVLSTNENEKGRS